MTPFADDSRHTSSPPKAAHPGSADSYQRQLVTEDVVKGVAIVQGSHAHQNLGPECQAYLLRPRRFSFKKKSSAWASNSAMHPTNSKLLRQGLVLTASDKPSRKPPHTRPRRPSFQDAGTAASNVCGWHPTASAKVPGSLRPRRPESIVPNA